MVVPIMSENKCKTKKIVGDGKKIMLRTNSDSLLVIGSGNTVIVDNNEGFIKVVGDGCNICVGNGNGSIEYNGDGGYLETGNSSNVKYRGDGGRIVKGQERKVASCEDINKGHKKKGTFVCNVTNKSFIVNSNSFFGIPHIRTPNIGSFVKKGNKS